MKRQMMILVVLLFFIAACAPQEVEQQQVTAETKEVTPPTVPQQDIGEIESGPEDIVAEAKPAVPKETMRTEDPAIPKDHKVTIARYAFNPRNLVVNRGDRVIWENLGNTPHEVLSNKFHSNPLLKGDTYSYTFDTKGNYTINSARYKATIGYVYVK